MKRYGILFSALFMMKAQGFLPSITDTIIPKHWLYTGPFSIGAREGIVGVIDSIEGFIPKKGDSLPSILAQGGEVYWRITEADSEGNVKLEYEDVWWDTLQDIYGIAGVINAGYAYTSFENRGKRRALAIAKRLGSFRLNDRVYPGDPYADPYMFTPVVIEDGENRIFIAKSGAGDGAFEFKLIPVPAPVMVLHDPTLPDVIEGHHLKSPIGITLLNTTTEKLDGVKLKIGGDDYFKEREKVVNNLHPLCVKKVALEVETRNLIRGKKEIWLPIEVSYKGEVYRDSFKIRVRKRGESFITTFISKIDNSVQYFAVLPPRDFDLNKKYGLILTCHGAGVEARGQVNAYTPKDWAFIVAPTNRRRYGFDWQDWGRLDFLEVLREMEKRYRIDENRIYLTGHSMGGHGAWHIGITHPDIFAALAPSAGWTSFQLYVPWFLQKSEIFSHPLQIAYRDMVLREDMPLVFLENLLNLPVFVLQGGADDNVPPIQARMFVRFLKDLKYKVEYMEVPGKGHWWDEEEIEGTACVNHPRLMEFFKNHRRDPYPKHIVFKTIDLAQNNRCYWIRIDEQEKLYQDSRIEAEVKGDTICIATQNIKGLSLELSRDLLPYDRIVFIIDGRGLEVPFKEELSFKKEKGRWRFGKIRHKGLYKSPSLYGPIKRAYFSPFVLVYGTLGDSSANDRTYRRAILQAWGWWRRANGYVEVLADTELTDSIIENYNLILFGGPEINLITRRVNSSLPIHIKDNHIYMGKKRLENPDLALEEVYPNPLNPKKLILLYCGASEKGERIAGFFSTLYSGAGVPDFVIYDSSVYKYGWGGVVATGFFNQDWRLDKNLLYQK